MLDAWNLARPRLEYYAERVALEAREGVAHVYFAQLGPANRLMTSVGFAIPIPRFANFINNSQAIAARVKATFPTASEFPQKLDFSAITPQHYKEFPSMVMRAAVGDDWAMMDFYNLEVPAKQLLERGQLPEVKDSLRVFVSPPTILHLINLGAQALKAEASNVSV